VSVSQEARKLLEPTSEKVRDRGGSSSEGRRGSWVSFL